MEEERRTKQSLDSPQTIEANKKYLHFCHQLNTNITGMAANYINLLKKN